MYSIYFIIEQIITNIRILKGIYIIAVSKNINHYSCNTIVIFNVIALFFKSVSRVNECEKREKLKSEFINITLF